MIKTGVFLLFSVLFNTAAHGLLKTNALRFTEGKEKGWFLERIFHISPYFMVAVLSFCISVFFYNRVLEKVKLGVAFPIMNSLVFILVAVTSVLIFKENLSLLNLGGYLTIIVGIVLVSL